jgi:hypothetical protein
MVKQAWQAWRSVAHSVGNFQARVLLTVFYVVLVFPFGIVVRSFSDSLRIMRRPTHWLEHPKETCDLYWARRQ